MNSVRETIFDDVFRTMAQKLPELLIPVINDIFNTSYSENITFTQLRNEYMQLSGKKIIDALISIEDRKFHGECESTNKSTMPIRMAEYDFAIGLEYAQKKDGRYEIHLPSSFVLYLRTYKTISDSIEVRIEFSPGRFFTYIIRTVKVQDYSKEEIFNKNLLFFLPFYILRYEDLLKKSCVREEVKKIEKEYEDIRIKLEKYFAGKDEKNRYMDLTSLIIRVINYVCRDRKEIKERLGDIMGGKVLELESERLMRIGREEGRAEGREEGRNEGKAEGELLLSKLIIKLISLGKATEVEIIARDEDVRKKYYKEFGILDEEAE